MTIWVSRCLFLSWIDLKATSSHCASSLYVMPHGSTSLIASQSSAWLTVIDARSQNATFTRSVFGTFLPVFTSGEMAHWVLLIQQEVEISTFLFPITSANDLLSSTALAFAFPISCFNGLLAGLC